MNKSRLIEIVENFGKARVAVLGDFCLDVIFRGKHVKHSRESPSSVNRISKLDYCPGAAANVAYNLAKLRVGEVAPFTIVGNYVPGSMNFNFGDTLLDLFKKEGINCKYILQDDRRPTFAYFKIRARGEGTSTVEAEVYRADLGSSSHLNEDEIKRLLRTLINPEDDVTPTPYCFFNSLIFSDYGKGIVTPKLFDDLKSRLGWYIEQDVIKVGTSRENIRMFRNFDLLCLNDYETVSAYKKFDEEERASDAEVAEYGKLLLAETESRNLIVSRGKDGMTVFENGEIYSVPTKPKQVVDIAGAGDTALAAVTAAWSVGATLVEAVKIGNYAAGIVVQKPGTATASKEEILKEIQNDGILD